MDTTIKINGTELPLEQLITSVKERSSNLTRYYLADAYTQLFARYLDEKEVENLTAEVRPQDSSLTNTGFTQDWIVTYSGHNIQYREVRDKESHPLTVRVGENVVPLADLTEQAFRAMQLKPKTGSIACPKGRINDLRYEVYVTLED
jgi:hypothetical protein